VLAVTRPRAEEKTRIKLDIKSAVKEIEAGGKKTKQPDP
jgi:hypothetical protein